MKNINIYNKKIGSDCPPFIIAEMSGNHNNSLERALLLVEEAAKAGVDALKIQTYTAETMTLNVANEDFIIGEGNIWEGNTLYNLYNKAYTPWEWHKPIFDKCKELGIIGFSTPYDESAVDFLEEFDVPLYKIASFENTDIPLLKKVAGTGKPVIISVGMATLSDIDEMVHTLRDSGCYDIVLLKCTSTYPANPNNSNIITIPNLKDTFNCHVGLSDHTLGIGVSIASVALGAKVIEKHLTLDRNDGGVDSTFSLEPSEMKNLVDEAKNAYESLGKVTYGATAGEKDSTKYRRSLYIGQDMKKGEIFTKNNLRRVRPGKGLAPKYYDLILGKKVKCDVKKGTPVNWDIIF